jgi:hypothetical protein
MRYLCLLYGDPAAHRQLSRIDSDAIKNESLDYDQQLMRQGHFVAANALQPPSTARTVKVRDGKVFKTDGPFAETKEQLGGFILIDARDMDQAVEIASRIPMARIWSIEVRPILELTRA